MKKLLFLCTGNSCRSQMAEGWGKHLKSDKYDFFSAGTKKHGMNPYAIKVMKEAGVSLESHYSKTLDELEEEIDIVVTVCSDANENCPYFPAKKVIHYGFDDPPRMSEKLNDEEEILNVYRRVRDEIKAFVLDLELHLK